MTRRIAAVALLCLASFLSAHAQDPTARMQQIIQASVDNKTFMGTVLVVKDGKTIINQGYGSADLEWNIPNTPSAKFRLGSLTKQFTAASILLLEERGKLKIDDPVSKYMPDAPAAWSKITIYNVLTHTSGIPSFTGFPDYATTEWKDTTPTELVARFRDKPLDFEPGTKFSYSNSGYVLLGYLIEKISGQTYADFLQQNIFTPLGMSDTGIDSQRRHHPAARARLHAVFERHPSRRLHQHDHPLLSRRPLLHHGRPPQVGAGPLRRQDPHPRLAHQNDHAFQVRLRLGPLHQQQ